MCGVGWIARRRRDEPDNDPGEPELEPLAAEVNVVAASQRADHTRCTNGSSPATASKINPMAGV